MAAQNVSMSLEIYTCYFIANRELQSTDLMLPGKVNDFVADPPPLSASPANISFSSHSTDGPNQATPLLETSSLILLVKSKRRQTNNIDIGIHTQVYSNYGG